MASTDEYAGLRQEEALKLYLKEERQMSQPDIDDFMRVYSTLTIEEVSELLFELIGKSIYRTCPVDMNTFMQDPYFLGTIYGDSIFPVWKKLLPEIYPAPLCKAYEEIILSTATRCFGKGFKVLMADGRVKNIEHIVVGDKVMGADNKPKTVIALQHGIDQMYKITPSKGMDSFTCNQHHTLFLRKTRDRHKPDEFVEMTAKEYYENIPERHKENYYRLWRADLIEFPEQTEKLPIDPYIFGTWLGDGHTASMRLTTADEELKDAWREYAESLDESLCMKYRESQLPNRQKPQWDISISLADVSLARVKGNPFKRYLNKLVKEYGHKRIPHEYLTSSVENRRAVLAGIIDTDGYFDNRSKGVRAGSRTITTKYADLAEDYAFLARSLGFRATIKERHKKLSYKEGVIYTSYDVNITGNMQDLPIRLPRKQSIRVSNRCLRTSKFDIEPIGLGEYFGFTIDDEKGLFLSRDGGFSHNCGKSTLIAISFAYEIMLMLCMINPAKTLLGKMSGSLVMAILSKDNQTAVSQVATDLYKILTLSPYFQSIIEGDLPFSNIEKKGVQVTDSVLLKAGSSLATLVGADLFACCLDEANIGTTKIAAEKLVETRLQLWQHAIDRRKATLDKAPAGTGIMLITSSPTEENDVIKARIDQVRNSGIPNVRIVDNLARWEARGTHATDTFDFFIGSDTKDPCLLEDVPDLILTPEEAKERVFKIPRTIEYLDAFRNEPIRAIQEMLGRRTNPENSFFRSVSAFERVFYKDNDIFSKDEIFLTLNGNIDLSDCLIDKEYFMHPHDPECYRYIHLDIASKQDRFGMASVYSKRVKFNSEEGIETSKRMYFVDFCLGLKARGGDAVDILKALDFIYQIKKQGYPVKLVTTDSHQGELSRQYLQKISNRTVKTDYQSVEKTKDAYFNLKNAILTEALVGYKNPILTKELKNLRETEKRVQKPTGNNYSDDMSDALAGALYSCTVDKYYMKTNEGVTDLITQFKSQQSYNRLYGKQSYNFRPFGM